MAFHYASGPAGGATVDGMLAVDMEEILYDGLIAFSR